MPIFHIATCRASRYREASDDGPIRTLEVAGCTPGPAGRPVRAVLVFSPELEAMRAPPTVGYATEHGPDGLAIVGWFPASAFAAWQAALCDGAREPVHYELRDAGATNGYVRRIGVGTGRLQAPPARSARRPAAPAMATAFALPH